MISLRGGMLMACIQEIGGNLPDRVENGKETALEGAFEHFSFLIKKNYLGN